MLETVFRQVPKHLKFCLKYSALCHIFNSLLLDILMKHCLSCLIYYVKHSCLYNKLHSYSFNYFSVSDWLIHHNQSLLTKFGENFVTLKQWRQNDIQSAAHCRLPIELLTRVFLTCWPRKPGDKVVLFLVSRKTKSEMAKLLN